MEQQSVVGWLAEELNKSRCVIINDAEYYILLEQAKEKEREKQLQKVEEQRQKIIDFIGWMNNVASNNPMAFETDHDDIADMFLNGYYNFK